MNQKNKAPDPHGDVCRTSYRLTGRAHDVHESSERIPEYVATLQELLQHSAELLVKYAPEKYDEASALLHISQLALRAHDIESETSPVFGQDIVSVFDGVPVLSMEKPDEQMEGQAQLPDRLMVRAYIPSMENPNIHIRHRTSTLPVISEDFSAARTQESMLHDLGINEFDFALSVDTQLSRETVFDSRTKKQVNISEIQTKAISRKQYPNAKLPTGYKWYDSTKITDDLGNKVEIGFFDDEKAD